MSGASERANVRTSGPVLQSLFLVFLANSGAAPPLIATTAYLFITAPLFIMAAPLFIAATPLSLSDNRRGNDNFRHHKKIVDYPALEGTIFSRRWASNESDMSGAGHWCTMDQQSRILGHLIIHFSRFKGERGNKWAQWSMWAKRAKWSTLMSGESEQANGLTSGPVLISRFLVDLNHNVIVTSE